MLHAWWPGGLIIGGLAAYALTQLGLGWQIKMATILIPAIVYGWMIVGQKFPATERVASGVSAREMFQEVLRPMFLLLAFCMVLTAATELAPNQWMESVLRNIAHTPGILVLVYISGLMFVMRFFAGPIARFRSPGRHENICGRSGSITTKLCRHRDRTRSCPRPVRSQSRASGARGRTPRRRCGRTEAWAR